MSKVSDIVICAAEYLVLDELANAMKSGDTLSGERLTERDDLLRCVNIAAADVALSVRAPSNYKICSSVGGGIFYSNVDERLLEVYDVRTTNGKKVAYTVYSDRVLIEDGTYYVYYTFVPVNLTLSSELPFPESTFGRAITYAVCSEYCVATGADGEANKWHVLFLREAEKLKIKRLASGGRLAARRWF